MKILNHKILGQVFVFLVVASVAIRDPFFLPAEQGKVHVADAGKKEILLRGIVQIDGRQAALISIGSDTDVFYEKAMVCGYSIDKITDDHVVLAKNDSKKIVKLE